MIEFITGATVAVLLLAAIRRAWRTSFWPAVARLMPLARREDVWQLAAEMSDPEVRS